VAAASRDAAGSRVTCALDDALRRIDAARETLEERCPYPLHTDDAARYVRALGAIEAALLILTPLVTRSRERSDGPARR